MCRSLACLLSCAFLLLGCRRDNSAEQADNDSPAKTSHGHQAAIEADATTAAFATLSGCETLATNSFIAEEFRKEDPLVDGWQSEAFHAQTDAQLKRLGALLTEGDPTKWNVSDLAVSSFACVALRPAETETVFEDDSVQVRRAAAVEDAELILHRGLAGLSAALLDLLAPVRHAKSRRAAFKEVHVVLDSDSATTTVDFQLSGELPAGTIQINATWELVWSRDKLPKLQRIEIADYEEVMPGTHGRLRFADVAAAVLGSNPSYHDQLLQGFDYWRGRSDRLLGSDLAGNLGITVGDVNGDGLDDVYVMQPGGLPNRLYLHQADGTAKDISAEAGVDFLDFSRAALFVDLDNDGDQDLLLGLYSGWLALENDGHARFTRRAAYLCPATVYSLVAADYDQDGDVDLYICGRYPQGALRDETRVQGLPIPYHDANNGGPNSLWQNNGNWQFENVTEAVGLDIHNRRFTLAAAWEDYDNDGDQDLYVANDFGRNNLYRNDAGKFTDVAADEGVEDIGAGMSASWGDYNGDGRMDLYVGNMFSSAGHRVAFQKQFMPDVDDSTRAAFQRHARGNSLFLNQGPRDGADFNDVTLSAAVNLGRWAWGSMFADLNADGREDLLVANGFITTPDPSDL